jgi:ferredoxin like protein
MTMPGNLKAKLGLNVFKPGHQPHIKIKPGAEKDERLRQVVNACPAGLYSVNEDGAVVLDIDGCLECGTCRIVCGPDLLEWDYPEAGAGVQFRCG